MKDTYLDLVNGPLGTVTKKLGLPAPVPLRRFDAADPKGGFLDAPVLVLGATPGAEYLAQVLLENDFDVRRHVTGSERYGTVIAGFDGLDDPAAMTETAVAVGGSLRHLARCARVITLSDAAHGVAAGSAGGGEARGVSDVQGASVAEAVSPGANAVRQGVIGYTRSLAHEMRSGATANGIVLDGVGADAPSVLGALWFLMSAKSAYVSGQFLTVSSEAGPSEAGAAIGRAAFAATGEDGPLGGRLAVVTGAARGIGAAIAETLARDGARVIGVDVPMAGQALAATMNRVGGRAVQLDITRKDAAQVIAKAAGAPIDVFVHNAGITRDKMLANMETDRFASVLEVNLAAQLRINAGLTELDAWGTAPRTVSLASTSGIAGNRGQSNYAASKAGLIGMVAAAAPDFAARGGSVNAVAPGFIETDMTAKMPPLTRQVARRLSSLQQGGHPVDVAEAIAFLSSDAAAGINGRTLRVCGQNMVGA
ncbi:3-oxoacyl-ACP reductase [Brevibacterium litoralis]|uniref:3-oxoacyl-ACP reductase n=1 Tax=Brevibacterium litoralis TaxID=3138935 RepID=UPI0032EBDA6D